METKEIIQALKCCHNLDECEDCEYKELGGFCEELLKRDAAARLEVLSADLCHLREVISILKKQLSEKQSEWISVEDPPKEDGKYFTYSKAGNMIPSFYRKEENWWGYSYVTHWMPLPEPPKPKEPTFKDVFLEAFPKTYIDEDGIPEDCVTEVFPWAKHPHCDDGSKCYDCWNQPYFEEEEGERNVATSK